MKRRRWWWAGGVMFCAALFAWANSAPDISLRSIGFRDVYGFRAAVFSLENHSRRSVVYEHIDLASGRALLRLRRGQEMEMINLSFKGSKRSLPPGEKFEFFVLMNMPGPPQLDAPFQVGAKFFNEPTPLRSWEKVAWRWLPKGWRSWTRPTAKEYLVWSEVVTP